MKKILTLITFLAISMTFLSGCSDIIDNKVTFQNLTSDKVFINFRASLIIVDANKLVDLTEVPKGKFAYATTYEEPAGTVSSTAVGDIEGELEIKAGTKVLIVYTSTFAEGVYTITATKTVSDDLANTGDRDPVGP